MSRGRAPLSHGARRVLLAICVISRQKGRPVTLADLEGIEPPATLLNRIHTLADRWLIVVDGAKIRPRQVAFRLLGIAGRNRPSA